MASAPEHRRGQPRAHRFARAAVVLAGWLAGSTVPSGGPEATPPPCEAPRGFGAQGRLESADAVVLFRMVPPAIEIGRHFAVEAIVCPAPPAGATTGLMVDARMPEHRHGMNYRPRVVKKSEGVYVAEGLLFHMPGLWRLIVDVERGGRTERLMTDIPLIIHCAASRTVQESIRDPLVDRRLDAFPLAASKGPEIHLLREETNTNAARSGYRSHRSRYP